MGYAIAEAALEARHEVMLISGPVALARAVRRANSFRVTTSDEMFDAAVAHVRALRCVRDVRGGLRLQARAVRAAENEEASARRFSLELEPTRDILASLTSRPHDLFCRRLRGRNAKTLEANAQRKLAEKNCDLIVANDVSRTDIGMECGRQ